MDPDRLLDGLDPSQRRAVTTEAQPLAILAGAGSGKTRVLTRRIAHRCTIGTADARHVLALTFTRKAAAELDGRLRAFGLRDVAAGAPAAPDTEFRIASMSKSFTALAVLKLRTWPFRGRIANVRLWTRTLGAAEIAAQYSNSAPMDTSSLVGWWKLDEGSGHGPVERGGGDNQQREAEDDQGPVE